jgi:hypothetical protein
MSSGLPHSLSHSLVYAHEAMGGYGSQASSLPATTDDHTMSFIPLRHHAGQSALGFLRPGPFVAVSTERAFFPNLIKLF